MEPANDPCVVFEAALALPYEKRADLLRQILVSLEPDEPSIVGFKRLMCEELERRWQELSQRGLITVDWKKLMAEIRQELMVRKSA